MDISQDLQTTKQRSDLMKRVRRNGTEAEVHVRRLLREVGASYRLNVSDLPGSPDIANKSRRKAIFVNGCYWHHHATCPRGRIPTRNRSFWKPKFEANRLRDQRKIWELKEGGFDVMVVWECELEDEELLAERLSNFWFPSSNGADHPQVDVLEELEDQKSGDRSDRTENFRLDLEKGEIVREVTLRDSSDGVSSLPIGAPVTTSDLAAAYDRTWLRSKERPSHVPNGQPVRVVDLFSGCGGMTVGVEEACRALGVRMDPVLAIDIDESARKVYHSNFPNADVRDDLIEDLLPGNPGAPLSTSESALREELGKVDLVVGGPPCQGHSDLNNYTRRSDPKNSLYLKMARFAEVIEPDHLIIENVRGVLHDRSGVFDRTRQELTKLGYEVAHGIMHAEAVGVAQKRHRVFMVASRKVRPDLEEVTRRFKVASRSVDWAIRDLVFSEPRGGIDEPARPSAITRRRIDHLFEEGEYDLPNELRPACHQKSHSYNSVYGRLKPHEPAPTITTGFQCMGQGRFVHPYRRRTLTPHEAARLQGFPDYFEFGELKRTSYGVLIGNAVPPKLVYVIAVELLR